MIASLLQAIGELLASLAYTLALSRSEKFKEPKGRPKG